MQVPLQLSVVTHDGSQVRVSISRVRNVCTGLYTVIIAECATGNVMSYESWSPWLVVVFDDRRDL